MPSLPPSGLTAGATQPANATHTHATPNKGDAIKRVSPLSTTSPSASSPSSPSSRSSPPSSSGRRCRPQSSWFLIHLTLWLSVGVLFVAYHLMGSHQGFGWFKTQQFTVHNQEAGAVSSPAASLPAPAWSQFSAVDIPHLRWGIMFDAGSTGSRVHVYRFRMTRASSSEGTDEESLHPVLEDELFLEVKPGLSAYMPNGVGASSSTRDLGATTGQLDATGPDAAARSLVPLLDACMDHVPPSARSNTPISLKATAGLRLLGEGPSEQILASIRTLFASYPFVMSDPTRDVMVMDGSDEGVYAWITVNYLREQLQEQRGGGEKQKQGEGQGATTNTLAQHPHPRTSAILDLGGASTQVVFEPDFSSLQSLPPHHRSLLYQLPYGSNEYHLFEKSYLGYGLMEARRRTKENLVTHPSLQVHPRIIHTSESEGEAQSSGSTPVTGVELSATTEDGLPILHHPCLSDSYQEVIEVDLEDAEGGSANMKKKRVLLKGYAQGHASCAALTRTLFPKTVACATHPHCSFGGHFALPLAHMFPKDASIYAFSYFYDRTIDVFDLEEEVDPLTGSADGAILKLGRMRQLADQVCSFSMQQQVVRTVEEVEAEKEAGREVTQRWKQAIQEKKEAGCRTVRIKNEDGSFTRVVVAEEQEEESASTSSPLTPEAAEAASAAAAAVADDDDDSAECMVEEKPDLSEAAEKKHQAISSPFVAMIASNPHLCLDLTYAHTLLHYGYDLPETSDLHIMKKLNEKEVGWCLGATLAMMAKRGW